MDRNYVPLRPAAITAVDAYVEPTPLKRRRVGVTVACDACRRKKSRCDGGRPTCGPCQRRREECTYQTAHGARGSSQEMVIEVIQLLALMPRDDVIQSLNQLKGISDANTILSILRGGMDGKLRPSDLAASKCLTNKPNITLELLARHPFTYPYLPPISSIDIDGLQAGAVQRLAESSTGESRLPLPGLTAKQTRTSSLFVETNFSNETPTKSGPAEATRPKTDFTSLCDSRLVDLDMSYWTNIQVPNRVAQEAISLYLQTDHPLLGHFEPDQFVSDLVSHQEQHCSPVLQMYSKINHEADAYITSFRAEAMSRWERESKSDSILNMAAAVFLGLAFVGQGRDHVVALYLSSATSMGMRLGLFGVDPRVSRETTSKMLPEDVFANSYAAWGVFNCITLLTVFYRQPGITYPRYPPTLPMPGQDLDSEEIHGSHDSAYYEDTPMGDSTCSNSEPEVPRLPDYMGRTFPIVCRFWLIMHDVALAYYEGESTPLKPPVLLEFAEYKFRELLALGDSLPTHFSRGEGNPHHVVILHFWIHAAILDVFRPCLERPASVNTRLKTFASQDSSPRAIWEASVDQLKRLIILYRLHYNSSAYTILWQTALLYVANAILHDTDRDDWLFYFMICVYGYEGLRPSFRVTEAITTGLLSMTLREGKLTTTSARQILRELKAKAIHRPTEAVNSDIALDIDLSRSDPEMASVASMASSFEDNALIRDLTNVFDDQEE